MKNLRSAVLSLTLAVALTPVVPPVSAGATPARPDVDPRAVEVLRAAGAALDRADVLSYDFAYIGALGSRGHATGHAVVGNGPDMWSMRYLAEVELGGTVGMDSYPTDFTLGSNGEAIWLLDHDQRIAHTGTARIESYNIARGLSFFTTPHPTRPPGNRFGVEIEDADIVRHIGRRTLDGVETDVIYLRFPTESMLGEQYLYFGRDDHFLRRAVVTILDPESPENAYHSDLAYRNVRVLEPGEEPSFVPERPAGYARNDIDEAAVNEGTEAPDWTLKTLDGGEEISLSDHRGEVVVLEFFATWCPICRAAMPVTQKLTEEFAGQPVRFLAINAYETGDVARFVDEVGIGYPVLVGGDVVADRYVAVYTPTTIVIDRSGVVVHREGGNPPGREQTLRSVIRAALGR